MNYGTDKRKDRWICMEENIHMNTRKNDQIDRQIDKLTDGWTDYEIHRQK
jgi:hypothetical protein